MQPSSDPEETYANRSHRDRKCCSSHMPRSTAASRVRFNPRQTQLVNVGQQKSLIETRQWCNGKKPMRTGTTDASLGSRSQQKQVTNRSKQAQRPCSFLSMTSPLHVSLSAVLLPSAPRAQGSVPSAKVCSLIAPLFSRKSGEKPSQACSKRSRYRICNKFANSKPFQCPFKPS